MNSRLVIDEAGRVEIPKPLREELHLQPGDTLDVERAGEQITLRPVRDPARLTQDQGVWVLHTGQPLSAAETNEVLERLREERNSA